MNEQPTFRMIMFDDLKKRGRQDIRRKIKSIRYRSFANRNALDVTAIDCLPEQIKFLDSFCKEYQYGYFDSMTDCYEYTSTDKPRGAKYVHTHYEFSDLHRTAAKNILERKYDVIDDKTAQARLNMRFDTAINRILYNGDL